MTLERLSLQNFQCHEQLRIKFDSQITTIVGGSDVGKSAIIRAIRWVAMNRPRGSGFVRHGQDSACVKLWVDDKRITRLRDKTSNCYQINDSKMEAVATTVPEPVSRLLNVDEVNIQGQHDQPFWFGLSPGEVAKRINSIVDLGLIDESLADIAAGLRKVKATAEVLEERWNESIEAVAKSDYVPIMADGLEELEKLHSEAVDTRALAGRLGACLDEAIIYRDRNKTLSVAMIRGLAAVSKGEDYAAVLEERDGLVESMEMAERAEQRAGQPIPDMTELMTIMDYRDELLIESESLDSLISVAADRTVEVIVVGEKLEEVGVVFDEETEGQCPICGGKL